MFTRNNYCVFFRSQVSKPLSPEKVKKKISPFDKRNKHLFRKRYVLPNKANVMVVTNKLMQGFGTSGSINDYRTKFLSGHFGNLFETFSLVIQIILSLLLVIFA